MVRQQSQHQMLNSNHFHNCQVTFAVSKASDDIQTEGQKRRRRCVIESDSD